MLNIELAVLQTLDPREWHTLDEISSATCLHQSSAAQALSELNQNGIVESRSSLDSSHCNSKVVEWRSQDGSLENYLRENVPGYL